MVRCWGVHDASITIERGESILVSIHNSPLTALVWCDEHGITHVAFGNREKDDVQIEANHERVLKVASHSGIPISWPRTREQALELASAIYDAVEHGQMDMAARLLGASE